MVVNSDCVRLGDREIRIEWGERGRREFSELLARLVVETCTRHSLVTCELIGVRFIDSDGSYRIELEASKDEEDVGSLETVLLGGFRLLFPGVIIEPRLKRVTPADPTGSGGTILH